MANHEIFTLKMAPLTPEELRTKAAGLKKEIFKQKLLTAFFLILGVLLILFFIISLFDVFLLELILPNSLSNLTSYCVVLGAIPFMLAGIYFAFTNSCKKLDSLETSLQGLQYCNSEACTIIQEWLTDETISSFRDKVVALERHFTHQEFQAMRSYWHSIPETKAAIQVYGEELGEKIFK